MKAKVSWKSPTMVVAFGLVLALVLTGCPNDPSQPELDITWSATSNDPANTTYIYLTFSRSVWGLSVAHVTVAPVQLAATPSPPPQDELSETHLEATARTAVITSGALTALDGNWLQWRLAVTVLEPGNVQVSVNFPGVESEPRQVHVHVARLSISGTPEVGQTLTAVTNLTGFYFHWERQMVGAWNWEMIPSATSSTIVVGEADIGRVIRVVAVRSNPYLHVNSEPTVPIPTLGTVTISGTPAVGQTLTAVTNFTGGSFQWLRHGSVGSTLLIHGAIGPTYVVCCCDVGRTISVEVIPHGFTYAIGSEPTIPIPTPPELRGMVTISGTLAVGQTLTAVTDLTGGSFQWQRLLPGGLWWEDILGATSSTFVVREQDLGYFLGVYVTHPSYSGSLIAGPTDPIARPVITGTITVSGIPRVGHTLTAIANVPSGASFEWQRGTTTITTGSSWNPVPVTGPTHVVQTADIAHTMRVVVTHYNYSGSLVSDLTDPVAHSVVTISGNPVVGQTLTAVTDIPGVSFQWERESWTRFTRITGATSSTFVVGASYESLGIRVVVYYDDYTYGIASDPTVPVTRPPITGTVTISGIPRVGHTLTAITTAPSGASFEWQHGTEPIWDAHNESTYIVRSWGDVGQAIRVVVTHPDYSGSLISVPTAPITPSVVTISGTPRVGQMLTAVTDLTGVSFRWYRHEPGGTWATAISGATSSTFVVRPDDVGHSIVVVVYRPHPSLSITSSPTVPVGP